ncbi:AbrB/MazE/SpoVT family DNA-binding domain-containing protein [Glycomyces albus]
MYKHDDESEKAVIAEVIAEPRVRMRHKGQLTVPPEIREALHIAEGDEVQFTLTKDGQVTVRGLTAIPADQAWFWTPEWQAGEREASEQIAAGAGTVYYSLEEFFDSLDGENPS